VRKILLIAAWSIFIIFGISAVGGTDQTDKNVSLFEGAEFAYVIYPPNGYQVITDEAIAAGYSIAFIPEGQSYKSASVTIDVNIFRLEKAKADNAYVIDLIKDDIKQLKKHFGKGLAIRTVDSVFNANKRLMPTLYFNDSSRFIPTVMMSYFNGKSEIIIFQLSIGRNQPRIRAEEIYLDCLGAFKSLIKGDINQRNKKLGKK